MMRFNSVFAGMTYKERQEHRAKRGIEIKAEKAAKAATAKTCQCCWRPIFAGTGTIAHHGYERPGYGYQTASCMGAKFLPFEVSRGRLGDLIEMLKDRLAGAIAARADAEAEKHPIAREYKPRPALMPITRPSRRLPDALRRLHDRTGRCWVSLRGLRDFGAGQSGAR